MDSIASSSIHTCPGSVDMKSEDGHGVTNGFKCSES